MAIYHATMKSFSRGKGDSSVAAAAYRAGFDVLDVGTGLGHNYSRRHGVAFHQMLAPRGAPSWCLDAKKFWNANEAAETRLNARVCREVEVSLPHSLAADQRQELALALGQLLVDRFQVAVLVAVHKPSKQGDQRNHHVHLLMSARKVDQDGLGERACAEFDARQGGGTRALRQIRKDIEQVINRHLAMAGHKSRVDHRSLRAQARDAALQGDFERARTLTRKPMRHLGKARVAVERKSKFTAEIHGVGGKEATMSLSRILMAHMKLSGGVLHHTPSKHNHAAALRELRREQLGKDSDAGLPSRDAMGNPVSQAKNRLAGASVPKGIHTAYSGQTRHLSRVARLARSTGKDAEMLNAEAKLIEDWLEAQREVAQQALEVLRLVPGIQIEPEFQQAHSALVCRRVDSYARKPFLFEDTESLAKAVSTYARMVIRPYRARMEVLNAQAALSEHGDAPTTHAAIRARRALARSKVHVSPRIVAIQNWRINQARQKMMDACKSLEKNFAVPTLEVLSADVTRNEADESAAQQAGNWELKIRRPRFVP
ncbi:TPA: MobA/MobL family protein [Stenotrophomonas maltophilia]|uniref:MobA/MobL family protein n=1 Tax=Stenotrophomonas maltophilia TaxID=40324 RepID=UPI0013DCA64E|nr:MobA/MobL family protein [Stenotrophomonas maltophilia]HDS1832067.1 MobA/MobL family protein [Stenotrophomonas maltophilia]